MSFPIVILDEAGQATEASSLVPLTLGAQWVLLGADLLQLPPTVRSNMGKKNYNYNGQSGGSLYGRSVPTPGPCFPSVSRAKRLQKSK
mmetsp:Transcript_36177/g.92479  ORF Transcript_36177/g.92479 Transcript_36177/m.92479 type:complete len:88 (-) Transcript_36177:1107-1370(-)